MLKELPAVDGLSGIQLSQTAGDLGLDFFAGIFLAKFAGNEIVLHGDTDQRGGVREAAGFHLFLDQFFCFALDFEVHRLSTHS
ncbi:MAG TPA: hypothetical protein VJN93_08830 [Candidatus Acidoferrum sp.]|nr:hypothetical protein [Candidatus Acidoferrum sp.]